MFNPRFRQAAAALSSAALLLAAAQALAEPAPAAEGATAAGGVTVTLVPGAWPVPEAPHVLNVLTQTADALLRHVGAPPRAVVEVGRASGGPGVSYRRDPADPYRVAVTAGYGQWPQMIYEFGHELCHVLSRFDAGASRRAPHPHQWFEEALCEAAALFALRVLARDWAEPSLGTHARAHARAMTQYAQTLRDEDHRSPAPHASLAAWYAANRGALARSPYYRARNEVVANALLDYFEQNPRRWAVLVNLNADPAAASATFRDYLQHWCDATPEPERPAVMDVMAMLGVPAAASPRESSAARQLAGGER